MPKTLRFALSLFVKKLALRRKGVQIYHNTVFDNIEFAGCAIIEPYCRLIGDPIISVGNNFYINVGCHLLGEIYIGDDVLIGPKTVIWGRDHGISRDVPMRLQPHVCAPVKIGSDVWIGANVTILKGVTIGDGCVIGAGSVVVRDIPPFSIVVGNPARTVKHR